MSTDRTDRQMVFPVKFVVMRRMFSLWSGEEKAGIEFNFWQIYSAIALAVFIERKKITECLNCSRLYTSTIAVGSVTNLYGRTLSLFQ